MVESFYDIYTSIYSTSYFWLQRPAMSESGLKLRWEVCCQTRILQQFRAESTQREETYWKICLEDMVALSRWDIYIHNTMCTKRHYIILRAAAPAADPGKNFLVLRTLRLSPFFLCILLWNIFDRLELVFENGFFIWVYVNIMILCFYGFMDLSNCIIVIYIYIYTIFLALLLYS